MATPRRLAALFTACLLTSACGSTSTATGTKGSGSDDAASGDGRSGETRQDGDGPTQEQELADDASRPSPPDPDAIDAEPSGGDATDGSDSSVRDATDTETKDSGSASTHDDESSGNPGDPTVSEAGAAPPGDPPEQSEDDSMEGGAVGDSNIGQPCSGVGDCTGISPQCQLPQVSLRMPMAPVSISGDNQIPIDTCQGDADCAAAPETPYCLQATSSTARACAECRSAEDCEIGSCAYGVCFTQCETAADCGRPELLQCVDSVCVNPSCATDDDCGANTACDTAAGSCRPRSCASDDECDEGSCIESECSALPGRCIDPGALDPDPANCVCGEGRICVTQANSYTRREYGERRCEPLPADCDQCSCAQFVLCPQEGTCDQGPQRLTCSDWVQ